MRPLLNIKAKGADFKKKFTFELGFSVPNKSRHQKKNIFEIFDF
jgi:hypothetical protein